MSKHSSILRSWLVAALCGVAVLTSSCQREVDTLTPAAGLAIGATVTPQEVAAIRQTFVAAGYTAKLNDASADGQRHHQWQPQWNSSFKADGAVFIPLTLPDKKLGNAKHFLVYGDNLFFFGLYIFPSAQAAALAEDSPAFLHTFTGKLAVRQLAADRSRLYVYTQGRVQPSTPGAGKGNQTEGCKTTYTCYWEGECSTGIPNTENLENDGSCATPQGPPCSSGQGSWYLWLSTSITRCDPDIPDDPHDQPLDKDIEMGVYKITALHSGLVLDVAGGSTADGAQVLQWFDQGSENQKWVVYPEGLGNPYAANGGWWLYSLTPYANYKMAAAAGLPPYDARLDQTLGILNWNNTTLSATNSSGAPAQIWRQTTSPYPWGGYFSPFMWRFWGFGSVTVGGQVRPVFALENAYSRQYLDVEGGPTATNAGRVLQQWPMQTAVSTTSNQRFYFTLLPDAL